MFSYQLTVVIKEPNIDEFIECLHSLIEGLRNENGCLEFSFYRDLEKENTYSLVGEWKTQAETYAPDCYTKQCRCL